MPPSKACSSSAITPSVVSLAGTKPCDALRELPREREVSHVVSRRAGGWRNGRRDGGGRNASRDGASRDGAGHEAHDVFKWFRAISSGFKGRLKEWFEGGSPPDGSELRM